jgi:hypothetical protein
MSGLLASSANGSQLASTAAAAGPIYTSADGGATWTAQNSGNAAWSALAMSADGTHLLAAVSGAGAQLHVSSDSGVTWSAQGPPLTWVNLGVSPNGVDMIANGANTSGQAVAYTSSDSGLAWTLQPASPNFNSLAWPTQAELIVSGSISTAFGIYISPDAGATWTLAEPNPYGIYGGNWSHVVASSDGTHIYATGDGLASSTNSGATWTINQSESWGEFATSADATVLVASAGGAASPVFISDDSSQYWTQLGSGGQQFSTFVVAGDDQKVVGATFQGSLYALSAITTVGTGGFIAGNQNQTATLQYYGNGLFSLIDNEGQLTAQ